MDKGHDACVIVVQLVTTDEIDKKYKDTNYENLFRNSLKCNADLSGEKVFIIVTKTQRWSERDG